MPERKLTKRNIDDIEPAQRDEFYWDDEVPGFGLKVTPAGSFVFVFQYRMGGRGTKTKRWTIGRYGPLTPEQARKEAKRLSALVSQGTDPVADKQERARVERTKGFAAYVETFAGGYLESEWGSSWKQAKGNLDRHVVPILGDRALPAIGAEHINEVLDALRSRPGLQRSVWAVLSSLFRWAESRDDILRSPMAKIKPPAGAKARKRVLSPDELTAVWRASYQLDDPRGALVRLLIITLQRRSEVAGMAWAEIDKQTGRWTIPAERSKNRHEHLVPLPALALAELDAIGWRTKGLVLPCSTGKTPVSNFSDTKAALDEAMRPILQELADNQADENGEERSEIEWKPWRFHDLRRTGTTNLQALGFPIEVTERVINHHQGGEASGIRGIYNLYEYLNEKTNALNAWSARLDSLIKKVPMPSNVVQLASARA
ncbi:MAG: hypothetical protein A4S12_11395 [Proteobacteria bacterium SG_bin5]|nr:integrase arm-type DNA-binding domain-containing protein [Sphingomonas sp.]OQW39551.1 MAG: hypothetical protein A4S12_11395 [Proteobacteria bacterium SG_bin5]